jgi:hypothetical protein
MTVSDRIRVQNVRVLSDNHYTLKIAVCGPEYFSMRKQD